MLVLGTETKDLHNPPLVMTCHDMMPLGYSKFRGLNKKSGEVCFTALFFSALCVRKVRNFHIIAGFGAFLAPQLFGM